MHLLFSLLLLLSAFIPSYISFKILASWVSLEFDWVSDQQRSAFLQSGSYIPENCALTGIKAYKDEIYLTVPRWLRGVPSTMNILKMVNNSYVLSPFPDWDFQDPSKPYGFKYIQSMEIDSQGRMWIIDVGRLNIVDSPESVVNGPAKIIILDINSKKIIQSLELSDSIAPYNASFLNDIVVDEKRGFAYISDTSGAVIIYDYKLNQAKRWTSPTMKNEANLDLTINGIAYGNTTFTTPIDGIALSHTGDHLFYCALQGLHLYSINTAYLRNLDKYNGILEEYIVNLGVKRAPSDGMSASRYEEVLFFGGLTTNAVYRWDMKKEFNIENQEIIYENKKDLHWVDTFSWDKKDLLLTSNKLDLFFVRKMDFTGSSGANFMIVRLYEKEIYESV